jgi:hypothetical protein
MGNTQIVGRAEIQKSDLTSLPTKLMGDTQTVGRAEIQKGELTAS